MLKLFYKTLLVSILSISLLMLNVSIDHKGPLVQFNSVQAETLKTDAISGDNIMATLTMAGVGLLASRLYSYKMTTDIMVAAAAGATFIAGDIVAFLKNKAVIKDLETQIMRDEAGKIDQKQIESLEKLKQSYVAANETANTKKMLQMAAAAAFAGAGVLAYTMAVNEAELLAQCTAGLAAATAAKAMDQGKCQMDFTTCIGGCSGPHYAACMAKCQTQLQICTQGVNNCAAKIAKDKAFLTKYTTAREVPSASIPALPLTTSEATEIISWPGTTKGACTPYGNNQNSAEAGGNCPTMAAINTAQSSGGNSMAWSMFSYSDIQKILNPSKTYVACNVEAKEKAENNKFIKQLSNFLLSEARADLLSPMGIASSAAIKYVLATSKTLATTLDMNLLIPKRRALAWGVMAGLSFAAASATGAEITKIQQNISKIDAILNSMYALQNGVASSNAGGVINPKIQSKILDNKKLAFNDVELKEIDLKANGGPGVLPCITGDNTGNCASFSEQLKKQGAIPDFLQSQIASVAAIADGISAKSKITAATLEQGRSLANQQNALSNELKKQQQILQTKLNASGSKTNLAVEGAALDSALKAIMQKELDANKTTAKAMLANFSAGGASGAGFGSALGTDASKNAAATVKAKSLPINQAITIPAATEFDTKTADLDAKTEADKKAEEEAAAVAAKNKAASMDDYALKENDITADKGASIFDVISNRYQKSYDKLFKRIKE